MSLWSRGKQRQAESSQRGSMLHLGDSDRPVEGQRRDPVKSAGMDIGNSEREWDAAKPAGMSDQAWKWGQAMFVICKSTPFAEQTATEIVEALISADSLAQHARQASIDAVEKKIDELLGWFTGVGMTIFKRIEDGSVDFRY